MKINYVYCDSCIFLAYFNQEAARIEILNQLFDEIQKDNDRKIITSVLSIAEAYKVNIETKRLQSDLEAKLDTFWGDTSLIEFIDIYEQISRQARTLMRRAIPLGYRLKPADAIHLASAQAVEVAEFFTYDDLGKFEKLTGFRILEPYVIQAQLPGIDDV